MTDTATHMSAAAPSTTPTYVRLSALLRDIPPGECSLIVEGWDSAVLKGTLRAVPLAGQYFGKVVQQPTGGKTRRTLQDEIVIDDEACRAWIAEQRRESRYRVLGSVGRVETTIERLGAQEDSFERLLDIRRRRLRAEQARGGAP